MNLIKQIQDYVTAIQTDFPASLSMLSDDIVWVNLLPEHVPFGGEYRGLEGVVEYFQEMSSHFVLGTYHFDKFEFIESENSVVLIGYEEGAKVPATGKVFDLNFVWVVKFDDKGKICYLREHNDTASIGNAFVADLPQASSL